MYIYHALINALSAHMVHINLNMIFYTHVEHSPTKTVDIKYYLNTHTHTHTRMRSRRHAGTHTIILIYALSHTHTHTHTHTRNDCSRNWVLILAWVKISKKREVFSLA